MFGALFVSCPKDTLVPEALMQREGEGEGERESTSGSQGILKKVNTGKVFVVYKYTLINCSWQSSV